MAHVPAELTVQSINPRCRSRSRNRAAATGDRQMLAVQIMRILAIDSYRTVLSHFGLEQAERPVATAIQDIDCIVVGVEKHVEIVAE